MAALWSRLCVVPQALHVQTRSASVRSSFMKPQTLQVLLDGYHLSILAKVFPCDVSLYSNIARNIPKPLSFVDLPSFREPANPRRLISSTNTASYRFHTRQLALLFCKFLFTLTIELRIVGCFAVAVNIKVMGRVIQAKRFLFSRNNRLDIFLELIQQ